MPKCRENARRRKARRLKNERTRWTWAPISCATGSVCLGLWGIPSLSDVAKMYGIPARLLENAETNYVSNSLPQAFITNASTPDVEITIKRLGSTSLSHAPTEFSGPSSDF